jgi:acetoacetyl-CoA reductase
LNSNPGATVQPQSVQSPSVCAACQARAGITVNAICPGYINTEMVQAVPKDVLEKSILPLIPIGRLGEPEEIARCVVFLAADDAGLITGSTLTANGGQYFA